MSKRNLTTSVLGDAGSAEATVVPNLESLNTGSDQYVTSISDTSEFNVFGQMKIYDNYWDTFFARHIVNAANAGTPSVVSQNAIIQSNTEGWVRADHMVLQVPVTFNYEWEYVKYFKEETVGPAAKRTFDFRKTDGSVVTPSLVLPEVNYHASNLATPETFPWDFAGQNNAGRVFSLDALLYGGHHSMMGCLDIFNRLRLLIGNNGQQIQKQIETEPIGMKINMANQRAGKLVQAANAHWGVRQPANFAPLDSSEETSNFALGLNLDPKDLSEREDQTDHVVDKVFLNMLSSVCSVNNYDTRTLAVSGDRRLCRTTRTRILTLPLQSIMPFFRGAKFLPPDFRFKFEIETNTGVQIFVKNNMGLVNQRQEIVTYEPTDILTGVAVTKVTFPNNAASGSSALGGKAYMDAAAMSGYRVNPEGTEWAPPGEHDTGKYNVKWFANPDDDNYEAPDNPLEDFQGAINKSGGRGLPLALAGAGATDATIGAAGMPMTPCHNKLTLTFSDNKPGLANGAISVSALTNGIELQYPWHVLRQPVQAAVSAMWLQKPFLYNYETIQLTEITPTDNSQNIHFAIAISTQRPTTLEFYLFPQQSENWTVDYANYQNPFHIRRIKNTPCIAGNVDRAQYNSVLGGPVQWTDFEVAFSGRTAYRMRNDTYTNHSRGVDSLHPYEFFCQLWEEQSMRSTTTEFNSEAVVERINSDYNLCHPQFNSIKSNSLLRLIIQPGGWTDRGVISSRQGATTITVNINFASKLSSKDRFCVFRTNPEQCVFDSDKNVTLIQWPAIKNNSGYLLPNVTAAP